MRLPRPLRRLNRSLKRIRYHSASRDQRWWRRASDWWVGLSLILSLPTMLVLDAQVRRETFIPLEFEVRLGRFSVDQPLYGMVERNVDGPWPINVPVAAARVSDTRNAGGWPLETSRIDGPPHIKVDFFDGRSMELIAPLPLDEQPLTDAISTALRDAELVDLAQAWREGQREYSRSYMTMLAQLVLLWVILFAAGIVFIQFSRGAIALFRNQRHQRTVKRLRKGVCPSCRYNLAGDTFPDRCPECGQRIWASSKRRA